MTERFFNSSAGIVTLAVIVFACLFIQLGSVPLFDEDEGAYAEVSREMVETGNWLVPQKEYKPFFHKPPMIYWTQAISIKLFGVNEFSFRLPSALASTAWAFCIFIFVRRFIGSSVAWMSVFFLVTALLTNIVAKAAIADALLNLFITTTMLALYTHYETGKRNWLIVAYAGMALGFMTKGPIAIAVPVIVSALFYLIQKRFKLWLKMVINPLGWLIFLAIALPWYFALIAEFGMDFVGEIFLVHNLGRFQSAMEGHSGPFFYYIPVIILGLLPFSTIVFASFWKIKEQWRSDLGRFLILWFGFVVILFSAAETKLPHYVIYGFVPLLIFMAQTAMTLRRPLLLTLPPLLFSLFVLILPFAAEKSLPYVTDEFSRIVINGALSEFGCFHYLISAIALLILLFIAFFRPLNITQRSIFTGIVFIGLTSFYLMPKVAGIMQEPLKTAALLAKDKGYEVVMWKMNYPSFNVYLGKPVLRRTPLPGDVVITKVNKLSKLGNHHILFQKHGFVLTQVE